MAEVDLDFATLDDALRALGGHSDQQTTLPPQVFDRKSHERRIFRAVFHTDFSQPTPHATPLAGFPGPGQPFGGPATPADSVTQTQGSDDLVLPDANNNQAYQAYRAYQAATQPHPAREPAEEQILFDRAWHVVTTRIALPSSVAAEDSFGTLAPDSQMPSQDAISEHAFQEACRLVLNAAVELPHAHHTEDILSWHTHQVRRHYAQHVLPMLNACAETPLSRQIQNSRRRDTRFYDHHMAVVLNSVRTLEAAFRQYLYGLTLIVRALPPDDDDEGGSNNKSSSNKQTQKSQKTQKTQLPEASAVISRFRQDIYALVSISASPSLMLSIRIVFAHIASIILGFHTPEQTMSTTPTGSPNAKRGLQNAALQTQLLGPPPKPPPEDDAQTQALRQKMHELLESLHNVGLAGGKFQILFAEVMDEKMVEFIQLSFAGRWAEASATTPGTEDAPGTGDGLASSKSRSRLSKAQAAASNNIAKLYDWMENHFARLSHEVVSHISRDKHDVISFADVKKWKEVALERLSVLRMTELFDIVLNWPRSRGGLEDLRVSVTTPNRRSQLVAAFSAAMKQRLLHPACSTLQILQTYIAMIHTFHALDPSNVLLSAAVGPLQLYLCQRDDAVRIVVDGLLADPEEDAIATSNQQVGGPTVAERIAQSVTSVSQGKLVELAAILNDPQQQRRRHIDEEELDWNDMEWVPDPIDAGTNYRRPKSEDVIGTLINALGSREAFTKEFQNMIAERLLSSQTVFSKEMKVLNLLKKRFGEASLQSCEVMMRDIQDSNRLDGIISTQLEKQRQQDEERAELPSWARPEPVEPDVHYEAKILSRLYWPGLSKDSFLLPNPVAAIQKRYEAGYEGHKSSRKLGWLNQLGQATVELELADRTVSIECKTYEATVIYAFQQSPDEAKVSSPDGAPVRRSAMELVEMLQMDEDLVDMALEFWQKQGILRPDATRADAYVVVESQSDAADETAGDSGASASATKSTTQPAAKSSSAAASAVNVPAPSKRRARADDAQRMVYWQFIVGMLTNSATSMPLAQISMMMKMLIADGFPWSNEELQEFLGEKVVDGELEVAGGKYRLVKK